jgi:indolepyruvate ferredoxin oxidoreductase
VKGDCPSFLEVIPQAKPAKAKRKLYRVEDAGKLPEPALKVGTDCNIFMAGIGGTGVVTINQIMGTAALLEGKHINALDQTGLSQKGGPVTSHLKISAQPVAASNKLGAGEADAYLGFDILTTVQNLSFANPDRTFAVVSTGKVPTGSMVTSTEAAFPDSAGLEATINRTTRAGDNIYFDALHLSETFFGDHMPANLIVVGAALQAGLIPLSAASIEKAIQLNGASVEKNLEAFRLGRKVVAQPEWASSLKPQRAGAVEVKPRLSGTARKLVDEVGASGELLRLLELRVPELIAYQNSGYARQYIELVKQVVKAERARTPGKTELGEAVARYLFKLMAYKDEYEVARLHLRPEARKAVEEAFGKGAQVQYLLHPPMLRAMGLKNKIKLGKWFDPAFIVLANMKRVRGTPLDVFGYAKVRKVERELIGEYRSLIEGLLKNLSEANHEKAVKLANLPDLIRGYEDLKLKNVARFREQVKLLSLETVATEKEAAAIH